MNFSKVLNFITENNINPDMIFNLVNEIKGLDLNNEENIRKIIRSVSILANKEVPKSKEDEIVREILKNGVSENILNLI